MTGDAVVLDGDRHESALTEKRGQFQEVCGCGWRSSWTTDEAAGKEHADHVAAEKGNYPFSVEDRGGLRPLDRPDGNADGTGSCESGGGEPPPTDGDEPVVRRRAA